MALGATGAGAEPIRIASFGTDLTRDGPGLLLRDILRRDDDVVEAAARIAAAAPDVIVLRDFDWDLEGRAARAFADVLADAGHPMPHHHAPPGNRGVPSGADLDGDERLDEADDALGWARFRGGGSMAVLSRHPFGMGSRDLSSLLWRDLPDAALAGPGGEATDHLDRRPLSTTAHWDLPVQTPGGTIRLLAWHATPPVFDGPEDLNGRRGGDEARLWLHYLDGALGQVPSGGPAPEGPLVVIGGANIDPLDGEGDHAAIRALLAHPVLTDPAPRGPARLQTEGQRGDPALDTVDWPSGPDRPGPLRVDYVLPSRDLGIRDAGLDWPAAEASSRHAIVWVDVELPPR